MNLIAWLFEPVFRAITRHLTRCGLIAHCADAPDMSGINAAAAANADIARDALDWYKAKDAEAKPMRDAQGQMAMDVAQQQLDASRAQTALTTDYADYQKDTFRPLEQGLVADAAAFDTPERRTAAASAAMADVNTQFGQASAASARRLASMGIDPGSARAMAAMNGNDVAQASTAANAAYKARQGVETLGYARRADAANLGRNLASNQATSAQVALSQGNSAVNNAGVPAAAQNASAGVYGQGFNTAIAGNASAGNLYGQVAQIQNQDQGLYGALGQVGGAAIAKWSDKNLKKDIHPANEDEALEEVTGTPVSNWQYDPAKMAARGLPMEPGDEGEQTGPMAQDVAANMGAEASDGKSLNLVTMNGKTMLAVKAVNKKVDKLATAVGSLTSKMAAMGLEPRATA